MKIELQAPWQKDDPAGSCLLFGWAIGGMCGTLTVGTWTALMFVPIRGLADKGLMYKIQDVAASSALPLVIRNLIEALGASLVIAPLALLGLYVSVRILFSYWHRHHSESEA